MSYDPSHRKPPRQERWPQATPPEGWPSYRDGDAYRDGEQADSRYAADRQGAYPATAGYRYQGASGEPADRGYQSAVATDTFPPASHGYGSAVGHGAADGYGDARDGGYDWTGNADGDSYSTTGKGSGYGYGGAASGDSYSTTGNGAGYGYGGAASGDSYSTTGNGAGYGYGGAASGDSYSSPGNGNGYGTDGYPGGGYTGGINGYAGAADDFAGAANGYGGPSSGYGGTVGGYPTSAEGYADAGDSFAGGPDHYSRTEVGHGQATNGYVSDASLYDWNENGYGTTADGYSSAADGYAGAADGYGTTADGYAGAADGYGSAADGFAGSAGYLGPGSYTEPGLSDPTLVAPDAGVDPYRWQADQDRRREASRRGLAVGAVTGLLATAVAIGVSTLAAGLFRSQASPMGALDTVFIDRMPTVLKNAAVHHFGTHGRTVLLLGMYVAIAILAVGIGMLARHAAGPGVAGLAAFSLVAAFVTITRPGGHVGDVAPAIIGGIAGVMALLWLLHASAPAPPPRQARRNDRWRAQ